MGTCDAEPVIAVKWDTQAGELHVVRAFLSHVWEGFDAGDGIIQSRETTRWVRELVGTVSLAEFAEPRACAGALGGLIRAAVQGTSRLPLNSVEAPLPAYSLGQLVYLGFQDGCAAGGQPLTTWQQLADLDDVPLESLLRALTSDQVATAAQRFAVKTRVGVPRLFRDLFRGVSLSPYTAFVDTTMAFVVALVDAGAMSALDEVDLWSWLLRQLGRHLTAYDLVTFHFRGANYPDALLLNAVLKRFIHYIETRPSLFLGDDNNVPKPQRQLRRRALRQACLLRRYYEGHPVPDAPTSPGENARVLPALHARVPDEQLLNTMRRKKRLYAGEPLADLLPPTSRTVLRESARDLVDPEEWRELGMAVFIERPLGWGKAVGEPDLTPLLAHEAYSSGIARRRCNELERLAKELQLDGVGNLRQHENLKVPGLPATQLAEPDRPTVALSDARRVSDDFVILRTLPQSLEEIFATVDFGPLHVRMPFPGRHDKLLVVRLPRQKASAVLAVYDGACRLRLELVTDLTEGFCTRAGRELPAAGLRVLRAWDETGTLVAEDVRLPLAAH